jgi:hypothetical protein
MPYRSLYIIAYDIASTQTPATRTPLPHRQCHPPAKQHLSLHRREDDIRAYPLPADSLRLELGGKIPEGVYCL